MTVDQVHDLQQVYRKLLHSMSRPGAISSVEGTVAHAEFDLPCYDATMLTALTLLDAEVTFHILSLNKQDLVEKISQYTLAKFAPIYEADYIIVLRDATETEIIQAIKKCKNGTLINPQASATWIIESSPLSPDAELWLEGPGIKDTTQLRVIFTSGMWKERNERVMEYPLGIDLIFTDGKHQIACVPRTTSMSLLGVY